MLRTILFFSILWLSLLISMILLIPVWLLELFHLTQMRKKGIQILIRRWSGIMLKIAGVKINKALPDVFPADNYAIVSNHQGSFDVLVVVHVLPVIPAFIAKKELKKIPFLSTWMKAMDCLFIDRSDSPGSRKKILERLRQQNHNPLMLFPEGTRSKQEKLLSFRTGGLKMIYDSRTDVLPVRINGTYKIWEETGRIKPGTVRFEVKPLVKAEEYSKLDFGDFVKKIKSLTGS